MTAKEVSTDTKNVKRLDEYEDVFEEDTTEALKV